MQNSLKFSNISQYFFQLVNELKIFFRLPNFFFMPTCLCPWDIENEISDDFLNPE